jgi:DNA-binding GntR family transcriptional regulator
MNPLDETLGKEPIPLRKDRSTVQETKPMSVLPVVPVPRETLHDHVYNGIKDLILTGDIVPGQSVTIQTLATAFAVSHMPVREALRKLVAERALTVISGRSVGVPRVSLQRLEDLRRVRIEIEGLAVQWACDRIGPAEIERLDHLFKIMDQAIGDGDVKAYLHGNRDFHFSIYSAAGSDTLSSMIENLWLQISPYFNLLYALGDFGRANREHRNVVDALRRKDGAAARIALVADITGAADALRHAVAEEHLR